MFIINLTYKTELENIDKYLTEHIDFLNEQYKQGVFLASGRKVPRTGGIILAKVDSKSELMKIIEKDPFKINGLADYELTEFIPSKTCDELNFLLE
ncbi:YciI family protein [Fulvivirga sp.]|uniref:YciI family protein n=1 Tax=Fulvivirga sp. TaxID=1931237 RepID=UPI0032EC8649